MDAAGVPPLSPTGPVFTHELHNGTLVLQPHHKLGSVQESELAKESGEVLEFLNHAGPVCVLLDLAQDEYLSSALIGAIVRLWKRIAQHGGRLALCNVSDTVHQILRITKLHTVWPIYASREEALHALGA